MRLCVAFFQLGIIDPLAELAAPGALSLTHDSLSFSFALPLSRAVHGTLEDVAATAPVNFEGSGRRSGALVLVLLPLQRPVLPRDLQAVTQIDGHDHTNP